MYSSPHKTNITQPTFYKPHDDNRRQQTEYELDHLATLTISPADRLETADDGMQRLQQMVSSSGVWTMRINLRISSKEVSVIEKKTGKELELFPVSHIFDPVCYPGSSESSQYKHIVIFMVRGDTSRKLRNEMHIFQSVNAEEQNLVDDLKAANIGMFPRVGSSEEAACDQRSIRSTNSRSTYEEDVNLLNSCLDYIEKFVVALQAAAHSQKRLRNLQNQAVDNDREIEYLTKHSQPPPNEDFVEVLRQFKFTFNLLPKLKNFLQDPNAPELARQLFHPLSMIVDTCRDKDNFAKLPSVIISPLLTVHACNLLHSCLYPAQMKLWKDLGNAWSTPLEKWTGDVPEPYYPSFESNARNNYSPPPSTSISTIGPVGSTSNRRDQNEYLHRLKAKRADIYVAKTTRTADSSKVKELSIREGEYLEMLYSPVEKGWWKVSNISNAEGFVPKIIIQKYDY